MKIYRRVVIDIDSGKTIAEDSFEYSGPVAECKGGGETNTQDPVYNAGLLELQQQQQGWAEEAWNLYKFGNIEGDPDAGNVSEMDYLQNVVEANQDLLGLQTDTTKKQLELKSGLLDKINEGVNIGERMDEAQAGVQHGFKLAQKAADMNVASYGMDPNSGKFASSNRGLALGEATAIAGARTQAKNYGEAEDFNRKVQGLQI